MAFTYTLGGKTFGGTPSGSTVSIGGKQVSVTPVSKTSSIKGGVFSGSASFGGGLPSTKSKVGEISTVLQQQAAARHAEIIRQQEIKNRTRDLNVKASALGQEQAAIRTRERELQQLQAKIAEAQRKPLTSQVFVNRLISEHTAKSQTLQTRSAQFNKRVGKFNAEAKGLSEQFQVQQAKEIKQVSPDVKLRRTPKGTLFSSFTSPETQRKRAIVEQRRISGTPLSEQFGLEAAEATRVGARIEKEARERAFSGEIGGLPGKYALQKEKLKDIERKASFASTGPLAGFGLTPGERKVEPIIRESVAKFEGPTRQRVKLLEEQRKQNPLLAIPIGWEELSTGGEITGRGYFAEVAGKEPKEVTKFKSKAQKTTTEFLGLQRTPLGTDEFSLFAGTREERQAKFGAAGRGITQLAALELAFAGADIGLKFAKSGKGVKTFDIGQAGGIGAGKKGRPKLPPKAVIKAGDVPGTFVVKEPKLFVFSKPTKGTFVVKEPKPFTFAKPKSGVVVQKFPKFADELVGGLEAGAVPKIGVEFKKTIKVPKVFRFDAKSSQLGEVITLTKTKTPTITTPKTGFFSVGKLKELDTTAGFGTTGQIKFKEFAGKVTDILKPAKKAEKDIGFFATTKISSAEAIERGSIFKEIRIGEARVAAVKRTGAIVKPVVKVKPAPFVSFTIPGSASGLAVGLPTRPKGGFEEIEFTTTRTRVGEIPDLQKVEGVSFGIKTEPVSIKTTRRLFDTGFKTTPVSITGQKSFLDVGLRTDLGLKTEFVSLTKQRQELETDIKLKTDTKLRTTSLTIPMQLSLTRDLTKQREDTLSIQRIIPIDLAITSARTRTRTITKPRVFSRLTTKTVPFEKIKRPIIPFLRLPRKKKKKPIETFGYKVFVRGKGKKTKKGFKSGEFIQATTGVLSRKEAMAFGQSKVAGVAKRTFRIVPTVGQRQKIGKIPKFRPEMFRTKGRTFIEKTRFAIDQPGERREITQAGISKLQGLRLTGFIKVRKKVKRKPLKKVKKRKTKKKKK